MEATKERGLKPRPKGTRARYTYTTATHTMTSTTTHNTQAKAITHIINKQIINKVLTNNEQCVIIIM